MKCSCGATHIWTTAGSPVQPGQLCDCGLERWPADAARPTPPYLNARDRRYLRGLVRRAGDHRYVQVEVDVLDRVNAYLTATLQDPT